MILILALTPTWSEHAYSPVQSFWPHLGRCGCGWFQNKCRIWVCVFRPALEPQERFSETFSKSRFGSDSDGLLGCCCSPLKKLETFCEIGCWVKFPRAVLFLPRRSPPDKFETFEIGLWVKFSRAVLFGRGSPHKKKNNFFFL